MRRLAAIALPWCAAAAALADGAPDPEAVRAARDAVFARPEFDYRPPPPGDSLLERVISTIQELSLRLQTEHPIVWWCGMGACVIALVAIVGHMVWSWRAARPTAYDDDATDVETAIRRLDPGPFRRRAAGLASEGRFDEAVRELYVALLLTLDRPGALRYAPHKALLDYRIEASGDADARAALDVFDEGYPPGSFGRRPPAAAEFERLSLTVDRVAVPAEARR